MSGTDGNTLTLLLSPETPLPQANMSAACELECEHYDHEHNHSDDGEDVQLIHGDSTSVNRSDEEVSIIDKCINASENNGNIMKLYTFSLAMVCLYVIDIHTFESIIIIFLLCFVYAYIF
jgi:hypothetical protein